MSNKRLFISILAALCAACYTPPVVQTVDTTRQQQELRTVASQLEEIPDRAENRIVQQDKLAIHRASGALQTTAATLADMETQLNRCSGFLKECGSQFESTAAKLRECKAETGFFAKVSGFFSKVGLFFVGFGIGIVATLVGIVAMHVSGTLAGVLARIPARV